MNNQNSMMNNQTPMMNNQSAMTTGVVPIQNGNIGTNDKSVSLTPFQERLEQYRDISKFKRPLIQLQYYGNNYEYEEALCMYMFGPEYLKSSFWLKTTNPYGFDDDNDYKDMHYPGVFRCYLMNKTYYDTHYLKRVKNVHPSVHTLL